MSKPKPLNQCKCPRDFIQKAKKDPKAEILPGGSHPYKIRGPKGSMPISSHGMRKEYGKGLRSAMRKQWVAIGLSPILIGLVLLLFG